MYVVNRCFPYKLTGIWGYSEIEEVGNTLPTRITTSELILTQLNLLTYPLEDITADVFYQRWNARHY